MFLIVDSNGELVVDDDFQRVIFDSQAEAATWAYETDEVDAMIVEFKAWTT
jgi:hypothetical protein